MSVNGCQSIAIVGAGQAAAQAVETLRRRAYRGSIVLMGEEPELPYQRPPLSKKYLAGALERTRLLIRPESYYSERGVDLRIGHRVQEIDRRNQRIRAEDGSASSAYDALLIATGSRSRLLSAAGVQFAGVHYLRTLGDADRLRQELQPGRRAVVIGGGYIGLEAAATAAECGLRVTVLEMANRVMKRVVCRELSQFYETEHARHGVRILCNAQVRAINADAAGRVRSVTCEDGSEHLADLVLIGVGVAAEDRLAADAGLECANGIVVDTACRTSDPRIFAAGDCTSHLSQHYGRRVRLESVENAFEQGTTAALAMLGEPVVHDKVPWFWSDQYDLKLVIVGLSQGHDATVVRGDPASRSFSVCYLRERELIAIDTVNAPKDQMAARKLVAARVNPNVEKLADANCPLKECL
ncbi:MAG: NAD(P)/FAD-dependent oxidoreductase [Steroidobacteraceae bacterium]